jgi:alpha-tubulin suppressor-like RCC1 family protein
MSEIRSRWLASAAVVAIVALSGCGRVAGGTVIASDAGPHEAAPPDAPTATACFGGQTLCHDNESGASYCAGLSTDNADCGACGHRCPAGEVCSGGACQASCSPPFVRCGSSCADLANDPNHCGACGTACGPYAHASAACVQGVCQEICDSGYLDCSGTANAGCNVDSTTDVDNCGGCGNACGPLMGASVQCSGGECSYACDAPHADCDGNAADGCEVDTTTDRKNCGSCGHACTAECGAGQCLTVSGLAAGGDHTCAALSDGSVYCWGLNLYGQLGDGTTTNRDVPTLVPGLSNVTMLDASFGDTCALLSGGSIECWGINTAGQLGDGTTTERHSPTPVASVSDATAVSIGSGHACALISGGSVECWGSNALGELGGTPYGKPVTALSGAVQVSAGGEHTCAVLAGGTLDCWGANSQGQLGDGTTTNRGTATPVPGLSGVTTVAATNDFTCALLSDGSVDCWGYNAEGQLGDGTTTNRYSPVRVKSVAGASALALGDTYFACAIVSGGSVACWAEPWIQPSPSPSDAIALAAGQNHACVLADGTVACWGFGYDGQLGGPAASFGQSLNPVAWP